MCKLPLRVSQRPSLGSVLAGIFLLSALLIAPPSGVSTAQADTKLSTPVYTDYNTFLDMTCILELVSVGSRRVDATVRVYRLDGVKIAEVPVAIEPGDQQDLIINDLIGNVSNTYGVVEVDFNSSSFDARLDGRMSFYRPKEDGSFSYAYSRQLNQTLTGTTSYGISNSYDAQGQNFLVPNWLQVVNITSSAKQFTINLYDLTGTLVRTGVVSLLPLERRDFSAGHELGRGVFLSEVIPEDPSTKYLAAVTRYANNNVAGANPTDFDYAASLYTVAGSGETQFVLASNLEEEDNFDQTNWIELANTSAAVISVTAKFYEQNGALVRTSSFQLQPKSQLHFLVSAIIQDNSYGSVSIETDTASSLLVQSTVYVHNANANDNRLQTAYVVPGMAAAPSPLFGSFNRFLSMENELLLVNVTSIARPVTVSLRSQGSDLSSNSLTPLGFTVQSLNLNDEETFSTEAETFGTVKLDHGDTNINYIAYTIRSRRNVDGSLEFVNPTIFR